MLFEGYSGGAIGWPINGCVNRVGTARWDRIPARNVVELQCGRVQDCGGCGAGQVRGVSGRKESHSWQPSGS